MPHSFVQVTLSTPYRSTIAITKFTRNMAQQRELVVPEGGIGSDVEGVQPIFFVVGQSEKRFEEALRICLEQMGDSVTLLYDDLSYPLKRALEVKVKEKAGTWECYDGFDFYGWEAEKVIVVTNGKWIMELITRARTKGGQS